MSWFADLAGKAETLLNNLDEQTGVALRNHSVTRKRNENHGSEYGVSHPTENVWMPKKRPIPRNFQKKPSISDNKPVYAASRKSSPTSHQPRSPVKESQDSSRNGSVKSKKSPSRRASPHRQYNLDHCPKTLVGETKNNDPIDDNFGLKHRRFSLPSDLELLNGDSWTYKMQNMEVENAMLKNELNVMNREVAELLDRLRKTEDGNDVDGPEVTKTRIKLETTEMLNQRHDLEKKSLTSQIELLKVKIEDHNNIETAKYKEQNQKLEAEVAQLRKRNTELDERCKELLSNAKERESAQVRLENDIRHAQSTISDLQGALHKTTEECRRLERDWESYKVRVKNMLQIKDSEIKELQTGLNITADTKLLMEEMDKLKGERDDLSEAVANIRSECSEMKAYLQQVEARNNAAERVVVALRDALREERTARNRAEGQCVAIAKEMKAIQMETGQTVASLRTALRDKEHELNRLRETTSTIRTSDTSALNVADYDLMQETMENNKLDYLTQTLIQRQTKIDNLLAENNMLRIQLDKMEAKFKSEMTGNRVNFSHSVVQFQDGDARRLRTYSPPTLSTLSLRLGVMVKRYPVIRMFVILYMVCLHFWVLTVLFTSTPEDYVPSPKS